MAITHTNGIVTIAASNTPATQKRIADYECDGTNDEVTIAAAIAALRTSGTVTLTGASQAEGANYTSQGGTIRFLSGDYNLDATLTITAPHHVRLEGEAGAIIYAKMTDTTNGIVFDGTANTYGLNRCEVLNLTFVGNYTSDEVRSGDLLVMDDCQYNMVRGCHFVKSGHDGLVLSSSSDNKGAEDKNVTNCQFLGCYRHGFYADGIHDFVFANNQSEENAQSATLGGHNIYMVDVIGAVITGSCSEDCVNGDDLHIDTSSWIKIANCEFEDDVDIDIRANAFCRIVNTLISTLTMVGGNSTAFDLANVSPGTLTVTQGTTSQFRMVGGRSGTTSITASYVFFAGHLATVNLSTTCTSFNFVGGKMVMGAITAANVTIAGCSKLSAAVAGKATISESFSMTGCHWYLAEDYEIECSANYAMINIDIVLHCDANTLTIDGNAKTGCRARLAGNWRTPTIVVGDIANFCWGNCVTIGTGTVTINNCDTSFIMSGIAMQNMTVSIPDTSAAQGVIGDCAGTGTIYNDTANVVAGTNAGITITTTP